MIIALAIIWWMVHHPPAPHWAVETWAWMCHHVVFTILIVLIGL